jgi:HlyD family type I secretion membrane fusion protein
MLDGCPNIDRWHRDVPHSARGLIAFGVCVLLVWGLGFGAWAAMAPLEGAVVASGSFVATGQNKQVQHLEGGIIREMLVNEGDLVEANQPLLRLDDTAVKAKLRSLILRQYRLIAMTARLEAEIHSFDKMELPAALAEQASDPEVKPILQGQEAELTARRTTLLAQEEVLRREISGLQETIRGYKSQVDSNHTRLALFDEELKDKSSLLDRQLIKKTEILDLQRAEASLSGELGDLLGRIGDAKDRIARADQEIAQFHSAAIEKAVEELRQTESDLDDVKEQIRASRDVVERTEIRAPVRGIVVKLNRHTPGGVVGPGDVILELLPVNDELVIEARVNPREITHVKEGQDALVRLTALNQRMTPMIEGKVVYVSADTVPDQVARSQVDSEASRRDSFVVRVRIDEDDARSKVENFRPTPGMPADLYIKTGQRTFFNYMMRPVADSFSRAFREH